MEKTEKTQGVQLPEAFLKRMRELLGAEAEAFEKSYDDERAQGLRFNTRKGDLKEDFLRYRERFGLKPVPWCREGFYYAADSRPGRSALHEAGAYYIQEPSAMAVVSVLNPQPGERVLDLCAAPGGKSTHLADRMQGKGLLVSNEIHPARAKILAQNIERMGIAHAVVTNEPPENLAPRFPEFFDRIVVDAPCSGEGMFRKDEEARNQWSLDHVKMCAERQQGILDEAASMLRPGGRMVYSTCTFAPEEDEEGIADFLSRHPEFSIVELPENETPEGISCARPDWSRIECPELVHTFRIWPHKAEGEGHYLALLEKAGESRTDGAETTDRDFADEPDDFSEYGREKAAEYSRAKGGKKEKKKEKGKKNASSAGGIGKEELTLWQEFEQETLAEPLPCANPSSRILFGEQLYQLPDGMPDLSGLRVLRPGLHLGTIKKNRLEPAHALALALRPDQVRRSMDYPADSLEVRTYLGGGTLSCDPSEKGWVLVCADGFSLGWAKATGGSLKNHYPKGLRIM
ncbi:RsmB/NOP family class I SAM-dependent RNA methyltransferase [Brotaphodocola sp.]|uniref:RsmB/NOP family class I SAM-dependent RNA methyltransferase n=1 Tax=Brotaphodocola sp. TaxID=3073577 RepID=UPI003D7EABF3